MSQYAVFKQNKAKYKKGQLKQGTEPSDKQAPRYAADAD